ncbi:hypothetical protein QR680_003836 [Steinernema hermaphroditum]|uniref:3'-5' exonuclease domain-containing protein n=1 Tax=Steinernema hermaphroditum TaxID=289476 RepID=A0AA39HLQ5_9BILA|nr:hypothetical protein QR680_003836 [Steinernema hermaphroditum]
MDDARRRSKGTWRKQRAQGEMSQGTMMLVEMRATCISKVLLTFDGRQKANDNNNGNISTITYLKVLFKEDDNPAEAFLDLYLASASVKGHMNLYKLAFEVYEECRTAKELKSESVGKELQNRAFNALLEKESIKGKREERKVVKSFHHFVKIFKFDQLDKSLDEHIKTFLSEGDYTSAGTLLAYGPSKLLDRHPDVLKQVIVPIFMIKHIEEGGIYEKLLKKLVKKAKTEQKLVLFLDDCLEKSNKERKNIVSSYKAMPENAIEALRDIKKVIKEYIGEFGVAKSDLPNYQRKLAVEDLYHLFKLYSEKNLTLEQLEDHARNAMMRSHTIPKLFVKKLQKQESAEEASKWEAFFQKPQALKQEYPEPYELDAFSVEFVRTETSKDIDKMTEVVRKVEKGNIIALDCENQAVYVTSTTKIALLQFAFDKKVFVVDTHSLGSDSDLNSAWKRFFEVFFGSGKHQVFGLGLDGDISNIGNTYTPLKDIQKKNVVKTERLILELKEQLPSSEFFKDLNPKIGLKDLYKKCFPNQPEMDKSEQMSCFDRRPLRKAQLDYAARDVIVLLKIFEKFKEEAARETNGVDAFSMLIFNSISS